jgi:hypothetical protein
MNPMMLGMVSLACNHSYSGGGIQEDCGLRPTWEKSLWDLTLTNKTWA